jgi:murE/murF fusion protein
MKKKNCEVNLDYIKKNGLKYKVSINVNNKKKYFNFNSNFESDIKNLLAAVLIISIFKDIMKLDENIFYNHKTPSGRGDISKIKIFKKNIYLVDESYNSNPLSLRLALKNFDSMRVNQAKKHIILGDMLELGRHSKKLHKAISKNINNTSINNVNLIGKYMKDVYKILHKNKRGLILRNSSEIISLIKNDINNNDYLMIKGSNSTGLNKLTNDLKMGKINAL